MSRLLSTIDEEDIEDQSSLFAMGLVSFYKSIAKTQQSLSVRERVYELLSSSKKNMDRITVMARLQYVEIDTKEEFTFFVLFYYFFWLDRFSQLITG